MIGTTPMTRASQLQPAARFLGGTAMAAALLLGGIAAPALADGFNGTISSSSNVTPVSPNEYNVFGSEAVINWDATATSATQTNIDFLPAGQTVTFHDSVGSSSGDFTVLNRVNPTFNGGGIPATISLSGTVNSFVNTATPAQGGNVWFYSPYGIIVNGSASFTVGGLLLTTSDIQLNGNNGLYLSQGNGNQIGFQQASQPGSFVRIASGAQINAANPTLNDTYVGIFAPRIEQGGTIRSKGMTALVAGEAGSITFNAGLINIAVDVGTSDPNGIVHTGTTGGPATVGGEARTVAMVAMSSNTALTMLLSGTVGYDTAATAAAEGGAVELYAGQTIQSDATPPDPNRLVLSGPGNDSTGTLNIGNTVFSSRLEALSTGAINVAPVYNAAVGPGLVDFQQSAQLTAGGSITLAADLGERIRARDSLFLAPMLRRTGEDVTITVTGDPAGLVAHGQIDVANTLLITADGAPQFNVAPDVTTGADGKGGTVNISVSRGSLSAGQGFVVSADGVGSDGLEAGGTGTGGDIDIGVSNQGTISGASLFASARGLGGNSFSPSGPSAGGAGAGGNLTLHDDGGSLAFGDVTGFADGQGGTGSTDAGGATGGTAIVRINAAPQTWGSLRLSAGATGGDIQSTTTTVGSVSGQANGVLLAISGAGRLTAGSVSLDNSARINGRSNTAYSALAGDADVRVSAGGGLTVTDLLSVTADADLPIDPPVPSGATAPTMRAGRANVVADGATISAAQVFIGASAAAIGASDTVASAQGGTASLGAVGGGSITLTGSGVSLVRAEAYGAVSPGGSNAVGGTARAYVDNGTINATGDLAVSASALAGGGNYNGSLSGLGFNAVGNAASVEVGVGGGSITVANLAVYAKGEASVAQQPDGTGDLLGFGVNDIIGIDGNGGTGTGGTAQIRVSGGTLNAGNVRIAAYGVGGGSDVATALAPYQSGSGIGNTALFTQTGGTVQLASLSLRADGLGGAFVSSGNPSATASNGGAASGGTARIALSGGSLVSAGPINLFVNAVGGAGMDAVSGASGAGGAANNAAALAEVLMPLGSTAALTVPSLTLDAGATGGNGGTGGTAAGNGGDAFAGTARISLADGAVTIPGAVLVGADATGGTGAAATSGAGGLAAFALTDSLAAPAIQRSLGTLLLSANGINPAFTAGTTRFTAQAGRPASALTIAGDLTALALGAPTPGDGFTGNFGVVPVAVGGNVLISTTRDINATTLAGGGLVATGTLDLIGRSVTISGPGLLSAGGNVQVLSESLINIGGLAAGGTTLLAAQDPATLAYGPITVTRLSSTGAVTVQSSSFTAGSPGALVFVPSFATTGAFSVTAAGNLTADAITAAGAISLASTTGNLTISGQQNGQSITLGAGGNILANAPLVTATNLNAAAGGTFVSTLAVAVPGQVNIDAVGGISIPSLTGGLSSSLRATGGAITIPILQLGGPLTLLARSATLGFTGNLALASATTTAGDLSVTGPGNLVVQAADASGALTLSSSAGTVQGTGPLRSGGNTAISGAGNVALGSVTSGGTTALTSTGGTLDVTGLASTGAVTANARSVTIASPGSLTFAPSSASAGNFTVTAAGDLAFSTLTAPGALNIQAGGLAAFSGLTRGSTIAVSSGDIRLGAAAQLGGRGTTSTITLTNTAPAATAIGGAAAASGWSLDAAEALRLFADQSISIAVPAQAAAPGDVVIGSLALTYGAGAAGQGPGANIGAGGTFAVTTPGRIRVNGAVAPVMASNADLVSLTAGQRIDVATDTGSIVLRNGAGALTGTLRMTAPTVRAATTSALNSLDGNTDLTAATIRLGLNDGIVSDAGKLQANALQFNVAATTLYIQNTGINSAVPNRRGFTANTLSITGLGAANPSFAINGVLMGANGAQITGLGVAPLITVNGALAAVGGQFNAASTVNGCTVGGDCAVGLPAIAPPYETIEQLVTLQRPGGGAEALLNLPLVQYGETPLLNSPPLIDEPVTGVGNDDLWLGRCSADKANTDRACAE